MKLWPRLAICAACLLLGEVVLRVLAGAESPRQSALAYQHPRLPLTQRGPAEGWAFLHDPRHGLQSVRVPKPGGELRVVVVGGSAAAGLGLSPRVSYPALLERSLAAAFPDRQVQVINLGTVAFAARQVEVLTEAALRELAPDLVVISSGNNEFLEPHAIRYRAATASLRSQLKSMLGELELVKLLRRISGTEPRSVDPPERRDGDDDGAAITQGRIIEQIDFGESDFEDVLSDYEQALLRTAHRVLDQGVPLLLCTVAVNWEWQGREDFATDEACQERSAVEWIELADREEPLSIERWRFLVQAAKRLDLDGQVERASALWLRALNEDPHQRRATEHHARAVRRVARVTGAKLFDAWDALAALDPAGRPGMTWFYDYVHFTIPGAVEMALGLLPEVADALHLGSPDVEQARRQLQSEFPASPAEDCLELDRFMGIGLDAQLVGQRDLWKYARWMDRMSQAFEAGTASGLEIIALGNARALEGNVTEAARLWSHPDAVAEAREVVVRNKAWLRARGWETGD